MTKLLLVTGTANVTMAAMVVLLKGDTAPFVVCAGLMGLCLLALGLCRK